MRTLKNLDLQTYNSYRLSSVADIAYFPESFDDVIELFDSKDVDNYFVLGGGYNIILASQKYLNKKFIVFSDNFKKYYTENNYIISWSGTSLKELSEYALQNELSGLEIFYDIPGTVGGAIWMNAGAYGETFMDLVEEVTFLNKKTNNVEKVLAPSILSGYRYSQFQDNQSVILSTKLSLTKKSKEIIYDKMIKTFIKRTQRLPKEFPNAGSVFKRPPDGLTVGEMVEKLKLKGLSAGGAKISEKHGGFIINDNNATSDDIMYLIDFIKLKVNEKYNVKLNLEQIPVYD